MAKSKKQKFTWQQYVTAVFAVIAVLFFSGWYFFNQIYLKPENVFWSMLDRNLKTGSITKTYSEGNDSGSYDLVSKLQLKGQPASQTKITIKNDNATLVTDTIGTPTQDYLKYNQEPVTDDMQNGMNTWAVNNASDTEPAQIYLNELLSTPILFGYLNHNQRTDLIKSMQDNQVFNTDFNSVNTTTVLNGKKVYVYDVGINLVNYLPIYQAYLRYMGQNNIADQIGDASPGATLTMKLVVEPISRHLLQTTVDNNGQTINFGIHDANKMIEIPKDVSMSIDDLQELISE